MGILQDLIDTCYITIPVMFLFLAVQLSLCMKASNMNIKIIPVYIIIIVFMVAFCLSAVDMSDGFIKIAIVGILILWIIIPGLIGIIAAWISYIVYKIIHPK